MRFLADMGVDQRVVDGLRAQGHHAVHLREQGLQRSPDADVFAKVIAEGRIILTFDLHFGEILTLSGGTTTKAGAPGGSGDRDDESRARRNVK